MSSIVKVGDLTLGGSVSLCEHDTEMRILAERLHSYITRIRELRSTATYSNVDSTSFFQV